VGKRQQPRAERGDGGAQVPPAAGHAAEARKSWWQLCAGPAGGSVQGAAAEVRRSWRWRRAGRRRDVGRGREREN
jgi:hypothetical protein